MPSFGTDFQRSAPYLVWPLLLFVAVFSYAEDNCGVIQNECKSPEDGAPLSAECIALRQACDPYFSLPYGVSVPGSDVIPRVRKLVDSDPYYTRTAEFMRFYTLTRVNHNGRYGHRPGDSPWFPGYLHVEPDSVRHDAVKPFSLLQEPTRSGFTERPVSEDFLFFWSNGMYYPYGGGQHLPIYRDPYFLPAD